MIFLVKNLCTKELGKIIVMASLVIETGKVALSSYK